MKILYLIKLFPIILTQIIFTDANKYALVIEPITDLIAKPSVVHSNIPLSPLNKTDLSSCGRIHQLLFNETVIILKEEADEVLIEMPHAFYHQNNNNHNTWTLKKNIVLFDDLIKKNIDTTKIPEAINYKKKDINNDQKIITLVSPFNDPITKKKYSAGTRFVYTENPENVENNNNFIAYIFDPATFTIKAVNIPKIICIINENKNKQQKIALFIKLLKSWAKIKNKFIPYVWGGSSFCDHYADKKFVLKELNSNGKNIAYYSYPNYDFNLKSGFDCSGLVLRAAQTCGIPFFFKNTTTIALNLQSLKENDAISNGDLIWIPGHIIVITDVKNNLCIEARDYSHGYGKVQEIHIKKLFKNIFNFEKLKKSYINKDTLLRLNSNGKVVQKIKNFKILKLESCWNWEYKE